MSLRPLDHLPTPSWPVALQQHPVFAAALAHLGVEHRCLGWSDRVNEGAVLVMQRHRPGRRGKMIKRSKRHGL
ncbi:MAG: hypothetical protein AAGJ39_10610, partial [Pseudomonadota bacterium]